MRLLTKLFGDSDGAPSVSAEPGAAGHRRPEHPRTYLDPNKALLAGLPIATPAQKLPPGSREKKASRQPPAERASEPAPRPLSSRPPHALVVSPVSLTPEEVQLPPGARQKQPTLFGLGAPTEIPPDTTAPVLLLADFALKLSLGPLARSWAPELRRCTETLLIAARHRHAPELAQSLGRLRALLQEEQAAGESRALVQGALREQLLGELSRLAEALHEWPSFARDLGAEARRREARIARELFAMVDGLRREARARMEGTPLQHILALSPEALAAELATPVERAAELREILDGYFRERLARGPDVDNALALGLALEELERSCLAFDACDPERKDEQRSLRLARRRAVSALGVLLAERGELTLLDELEPSSSAGRARRAREWLAASPGKKLREGSR